VVAFDGIRKALASLFGGGESEEAGRGLRNGDGTAPAAASTGGADERPMLSCEEARERLFEFLDGELDPLEASEVQRHVDVCSACYPRFRFEQQFLEALRRAEERGAAGSELKERVLAALQQVGDADGS